MSRAFAGKLAERFGFDKRLTGSSDLLACRFEAYIGALWCEKGPSAALSLLAPLSKEELRSSGVLLASEETTEPFDFVPAQPKPSKSPKKAFQYSEALLPPEMRSADVGAEQNGCTTLLFRMLVIDSRTTYSSTDTENTLCEDDAR